MDKSTERLEINKCTKSSKSIVITENRSSEDDKASLQSLVCRICFDDGREEPIITPCHCKGTVAFVHKSCLEKWLSESNTTSCELCHHVYETERIPKYTAKQSIWHWIWYQPQNVGFQVRRLRGDLLACTILTPLAILVTYVCLFSADYYNQQKFSNIPVAKWTSISLLVMISILLCGYYLWVYVVVGYHGRTWYYWWQRECVVRYIPPLSNSCCEITTPINSITNPLEVEPTLQNADANEGSRNEDIGGAVVIYVNSLVNNNEENVIVQSGSENPPNHVTIEVSKSNEANANVNTSIDSINQQDISIAQRENFQSTDSLQSGDTQH